MSIRTFIFCDICNPQGLRSIEFRRSCREEVRSGGRRLCDGRTWYEGLWSEAIKEGWSSTPKYPHICPACQQHNN